MRTFPLILLLPDDTVPRLICSAEDLPQRAPELLKEKDLWQKARFIGMQGSFGIADITSDRKPGLLANLLHGKDTAWWNLRVQLTATAPADIEPLKQQLLQAIAADDDILTQYYSDPCLAFLVKRCRDVAELIVTGCLTGCIPCTGIIPAGLPALHEGFDDYEEDAYEDTDANPADLQHYSAPGYTGPLSEANIRDLAAHLPQAPFNWQFLSTH